MQVNNKEIEKQHKEWVANTLVTKKNLTCCIIENSLYVSTVFNNRQFERENINNLLNFFTKKTKKKSKHLQHPTARFRMF